MIGLGTYAFFWQHSDRMREQGLQPLSLIGAFEATRELDVDLFQICDYSPLETMSDSELADAAAAARDLGLTIELGTKGIDPAHLERFLRLAEVFDAHLVRSMLYGPESRPTLGEAEQQLRVALPVVRGLERHARARDVRAGRDVRPGRAHRLVRQRTAGHLPRPRQRRRAAGTPT